MLTFDQYAYRSRLAGSDARLKVAIYLLLLGISFTGILGWQMALIGLVCPISLYVGRVHWRTYLKWLFLPLPFVLLSLVTIVMSFQSASSEQALLNIPLFKGYLTVTQVSLFQAMSLFFRVYSSLVSTYFLVLTVPFKQLIELLRKLRVPDYLLEVMVLMYRFIFMFLHEFIVMRDTLDLKFAFGHMRQTYRSMGLLASQLFTRLIRANDELTAFLALRFDE